ncbi:MAG: DNA adenine methylase [Bacteroidia bacterium]
MIRSPLRYPGGKSRAVGLISGLIPEYAEYREPFVGGGSVYIQQKQIHPEGIFWINDLYEPLYHFWNQLKENKNQLIDAIRKFRKMFTDGKELFYFLKHNYTRFSILEKAAAFFIFNRITFSGTSDSGGFSKASFTGRFTESSIERISLVQPVLENTKVSNLDYEILITTPGKNVFLFLDPPYYSATRSALYGKNGNLHKSFDHLRFADLMKNCRYNWLITYDDSPFIRDLFSFANIFSWDLKYGMRNVSNVSDQNGKELFISNYLSEFNAHDKVKKSTIHHEVL